MQQDMHLQRGINGQTLRSPDQRPITFEVPHLLNEITKLPPIVGAHIVHFDDQSAREFE